MPRPEEIDFHWEYVSMKARLRDLHYSPKLSEAELRAGVKKLYEEAREKTSW